MKRLVAVCASSLLMCACSLRPPGPEVGTTGRLPTSSVLRKEYIPTLQSAGAYRAGHDSSANAAFTPWWRRQPRTRQPADTGIYFHGGAVIDGTPDVYLIWYGNWSGQGGGYGGGQLAGSDGPQTVSLLRDTFFQGESGSGYYNIITTYHDASNTPLTNALKVAGSTTDHYSRGNSLSDADVQGIVSNSLSSGALPVDPQGVYFVLSSSDVAETSGFCSTYCSWHTYFTYGGSDVPYAFVGNTDRCPSTCEVDTTASPNNDPGADGMANLMAHELAEAVTDPDLAAWYDHQGNENADKCAWQFGRTSSGGSRDSGQYSYNQSWGGHDWLIQMDWIDAGSGGCRQQWP